jgi:voltage-gated potassium channel
MSPVSLTGRCVAVALMLGGIALLGTVTATLASWIVQRVAEEDIAGQAATAQQVEALVKQVELLPQQLPPHQAAPPPSLRARPRRRRPPKVRTSIRA